MARLTITISDERHRALKQRAALTGKSIGQLIEESLERTGVKSREDARDVLRRASQTADLSEEEALNAAVGETRAQRKRGNS